MKKATFPAILVLVVILGFGYWWVMTKIPSETKPPANPPAQQNGTSELPTEATTISTSPSTSTLDGTANTATSSAAINQQTTALPTVEYVEISQSAFSPAIVTIHKNTVIKWSNNDSIPHTVTEDNGLFGSPTLRPRDGFTYTFSQVGTYTYHCSFHPNMKGSVIVKE